MADGFLGRWARRKEAVRKGQEVPAEPAKLAEPVPSAPPTQPAAIGAGSEQEAPPAPTLEDTETLTPASDFRRFVQRDVAPDVRNAAMKKLWADPHFNVMDGLDTYIGDYNTPDPMPPAMLRQLASAKFLNLFRAEEEQEERERLAQLEREGKAPTDREVADVPASESVAQSSTGTEHALPPAEDHANPDLRLQQDDAPGPEGPGAGSR